MIKVTNLVDDVRKFEFKNQWIFFPGKKSKELEGNISDVGSGSRDHPFFKVEEINAKKKKNKND